jgi:micrococcal nuclease
MVIQAKSFFNFITAIILITSINGCGLFYDYGHNTDEAGMESSGDTYKVKEVIDGDTIVLAEGRRIRLIGINTPEQDMYFFEEAKDALGIMISDREITLEKDISEMDKYGRLLRYIYTKELFINLEMIKRGFASCYTYPPDVKYSEEFARAERYAREKGMGLWESSRVSNIIVVMHYDANGDDRKNLNDEYVIVENTGSESINIYGWTVKDSGTAIYKFDEYCLEPNNPIYLFTGAGEDGDGAFYWGSTGPVWNNDHDTLYLRDGDGKLVEIYNY